MIPFGIVKQHTVEDGDCMSSIAEEYGFSVDTLWNSSDNSSLKDLRKDPNTLVPGDIVVIPDRTEKTVSCETAQTHKFKLSGAPTMFRLQLFEDEKALASLDWQMDIAGKKYSGTTDASGVLEGDRASE